MQLLLLLGVLLIARGECLRKPPRDKSLLYEKYPVLNGTDTPECTRAFNRLLTSMLSAPYDSMTSLYGARYINDLGSYSGCQTLAPHAEFAVANFNLSRLPIIVSFGFCLPSECSQLDYTRTTDQVNALLNSLYQSFINATGFNTHMTKNFTVLELSLHKVDEGRE